MVRNLFPKLVFTAACCVQASAFMAPETRTLRLDLAIQTPPPLPSTEASVTEENESKKAVDLPPVIKSIADDRREFQMNLGKAMDTLRKDLPDILRREPDFGIYDEQISLIDPSGVQLTGIDSYKSSIKFLQTFIKFWFQERSGLQYRMVFDFARSSIRVSWHAVLVPKVPLGRPLHVDGISLYKLSLSTGKIVEHKLENLVINNTPVVPPYGVFTLIQQQQLGGLSGHPGLGIPAGV